MGTWWSMPPMHAIQGEKPHNTIIRNLCPPVRPSINVLNRRLALLTGISTGLSTGRLDGRFDQW